jgi:hypothetical protein
MARFISGQTLSRDIVLSGPLGIHLDPMATAEIENPWAAAPMPVTPHRKRISFGREASPIANALYKAGPLGVGVGRTNGALAVAVLN